MFDFSRITRLATIALAACAVTWAFAGVAAAQPYPPNDDAGGAPAYKAVVVDVNKAPSQVGPSSRNNVAGDVNKTPDPAQVQRVLDSLPGKSAPASPAVSGGGNDDTGTIALIVAIAAILTALAAMTMTVTRSNRPVLRH